MTTATNFTSTSCGQDAGDAVCAAAAGMPPGGVMAINGSTDLSRCIVGPSGALVNGIYINTVPGRLYQYAIMVTGQGPSGASTGKLDLEFTDAGGNHYLLELWSSTNETHQVDYSSDTPSITQVTWRHKG